MTMSPAMANTLRSFPRTRESSFHTTNAGWRKQVPACAGTSGWSVARNSSTARHAVGTAPSPRFAKLGRLAKRNGPLHRGGGVRVRPTRSGPPTVKIRFAHCDPAGIVYFASHFDILNGVVEDWFVEGLGLDYHDIVGRRRVGLGYVHASADFRLPARMGDRLIYAVAVERVGTKSLPLRVTAREGRRRDAHGDARHRHHRSRPHGVDRRSPTTSAPPCRPTGRRPRDRKASPAKTREAERPRPPGAAARRLAGAERLCQRRRREGAHGVHRRPGRLGRDGRVRRGDRRRRSRQTLQNTLAVLGAGRRRAGAHRPHDLVRDRRRRLIVAARKEIGAAYARRDRAALSADGGGRGRAPGRARARWSRSRPPRWCRSDKAGRSGVA